MAAASGNTGIFLEQVKKLIRAARGEVVQSVNTLMVRTYFELGRRIVEQEQKGKRQADYGAYLLDSLSRALTAEFGKGYSRRNLELIRKFYLTYRFAKTVFSQSLSWSHYLLLMRIPEKQERKFYELETVKNNWSFRELNRQISSSLYERLCLSADNKKVKVLAAKGQTIQNPADLIKDPYVLEFLQLSEHSSYSETELESALIGKLEQFLLELGNGFTFVGRQVRFTFEEEHFRVDLVFYNRILRCFVLIDLKIGKLRHQDLGQMQMYVNYYDRHVRLENEERTIGIILCKDKNDTMVEITLPEGSNRIFASKYKLVLPSKNEFRRIMKV